MTWKEFKDVVEAKGAEDEDIITFFDWDGADREPRVEHYEGGKIFVYV